MEIFVQKWYLRRPKEQFPLGMREMGFDKGMSHCKSVGTWASTKPPESYGIPGMLFHGYSPCGIVTECGLPLGKRYDIISDRSLQLREMLREGPSWESSTLPGPRGMSALCMKGGSGITCITLSLDFEFLSEEFDLLIFTYSESKMMLAFSRRLRISYWINIILAVYRKI